MDYTEYWTLKHWIFLSKFSLKLPSNYKRYSSAIIVRSIYECSFSNVFYIVFLKYIHILIVQFTMLYLFIIIISFAHNCFLKVNDLSIFPYSIYPLRIFYRWLKCLYSLLKRFLYSCVPLHLVQQSTLLNICSKIAWRFILQINNIRL